MTYKLLRQLAVTLLLGAAFQPLAFPQYPYKLPVFPPEQYADQPGVLSQAELDAANEAMKAVAGNVPKIRRIASGKLSEKQSFVLYDTPYEKASDRVQTSTRLTCYYLSPRPNDERVWGCIIGPYIVVRIAKDGVTRDVAFSIHEDGVRGLQYLPEHPQIAADIVDFVYSPCFGAQYAGVARQGDPPPPVSPSIHSMMMSRRLGVISVTIGDAPALSTFGLTRIGADKAGCAFTIYGWIDRDRAALAEKQSKEYREQSARAETESRNRARALEEYERNRASGKEWGIELFQWGLLCGLAALVVPWFAMRAGRWVAAATAVVLTGAFYYLNVLHVKYGDVGNEGLITLLVALLTSVLVAGLLLWAAAGAIIGDVRKTGQTSGEIRRGPARTAAHKRIAWILWLAGLAVIVYKLGPWFFWPK